MAATHFNTNEQVYNVQEDESLALLVAHVICIIVQRGLMIAGFSSTKELLILNYTGYNNNKPVWELDFFEHLFGQEPLLAERDKVKGVFICSDRNMVVPNDLYEQKEAEAWLRRLYMIEPKDVITAYPLENDNAQYLQAMPMSITELVNINFKKAATLPLPVYHFRNANRQSLYLQCCITGDQACATLHNYSQLLWHRVFDYRCAEDIAFAISQLCVENNISISDISLSCTSVSAAEYDVVNELSQYFPGMRNGNGTIISTRWDTAICLAEQLFACV